jgi:hypothetical protein
MELNRRIVGTKSLKVCVERGKEELSKDCDDKRDGTRKSLFQPKSGKIKESMCESKRIKDRPKDGEKESRREI